MTVTRSNALESLVIAGFVRGLSVRDVQNTLADALGAEAALSKSTVSRVCQAIGQEFDAWSTRRLDELELDYLFLDASMFKMHPGARAEPVLAAWGITTAGAPVFVALAAGGSESTDAWAGFLDELTSRGLRPPLLVISDGAAGLLAAVETALPHSLRQRCLIHRSRNVLAKIGPESQIEIHDAYWKIFDTETLTGTGVTSGQDLIAAVQHRIDEFIQKYARSYPAAVKCLLTDRAQLTSYLRCPVEHHHRIRHSNFIEGNLRRNPPPRQSHRPSPRRNLVSQPGLGRAGPGLPRLARYDHHPRRHPCPGRPTPPTPGPTHTDPHRPRRRTATRGRSGRRSRGLTSTIRNPRSESIYTESGTRPSNAAERLSVLRRPDDAPPLPDCVPRGVGLWEPVPETARQILVSYSAQGDLRRDLEAQLGPVERGGQEV